MLERVKFAAITSNNLDEFLMVYNTKRPHQGRGMKGKTPYKAFAAGIPKQEQPAPSADQAAA